MTVTLTKQQARGLETYLSDICEEEIDLRVDYSGRGMYGDSCLGFVTKNPEKLMYELGFLIGQSIEWKAHQNSFPGWNPSDYDFAEQLNDVAGTPELDNMGMDYIIYWPDIKVKQQ